MKHSLEPIHMIDQLAAHTWPAEQEMPCGEWLLRASGGVTKRANSVFTVGGYPRDPDWLQQIEDFYRERALPAIFHVSDASPADLDEQLEKNGYRCEIPCLLMTASSDEVQRKSLNAWMHKRTQETEVRYLEAADGEWLEQFLRLEQFPDERMNFYEGLVKRMPSPKCFVQLLQNGKTVGLGTTVVENGWAGFLNVVVHEESRGQGLGYLILHALTKWSVQHGAVNQYLQVVADNRNALGLYEKAGYRPLFGYHYRVKYDLQSPDPS